MPREALAPVVVLGPTAVGKSVVGVEVALRSHGEIISADSRSFFRGLDIATDKPSLVARRGVPHHLIDRVDLAEGYDAMSFRKDAARLIPAIQGRAHLPIIVGGGTLYLGAILRGIFEGPSADEGLRKELESRPRQELYDRLHKIDPEAAAKIHPNDRLRIVRALEVYELTGNPISVLQRRARPLGYSFRIIGLSRERAEHRRVIADRVDGMLRRGLIDEVKRLKAKGLGPGTQVYRTIGVREVFSYLAGEIGLEELRGQIIVNTWRLVRRQLAWFRNDEGVNWLNVTGRSVDDITDEIICRLGV
ncbi:MAG: tRNA (adenosine(37)-N6)-dimethylallyltransferase MiaA [Candidatus Bipolaricaulota bacterium]|nr:tRNA (adenosine(37)-N6)-dimethylallyltransferase MiaA [Candidatus Bipolaricaulota bacterium]